jgi:hypothetical protein
MNLICPKCLEEQPVRLDLADGDTLSCPGCDEEYSLDAVQAMVEGWAKLLPWLRLHPARQEQPAAAG